jgi:hypothetical protein
LAWNRSPFADANACSHFPTEEIDEEEYRRRLAVLQGTSRAADG